MNHVIKQLVGWVNHAVYAGGGTNLPSYTELYNLLMNSEMGQVFEFHDKIPNMLEDYRHNYHEDDPAETDYSLRMCYLYLARRVIYTIETAGSTPLGKWMRGIQDPTALSDSDKFSNDSPGIVFDDGLVEYRNELLVHVFNTGFAKTEIKYLGEEFGREVEIQCHRNQSLVLKVTRMNGEEMRCQAFNQSDFEEAVYRYIREIYKI